jgi:Transcriptional Coactivator p15 (PC4)
MSRRPTLDEPVVISKFWKNRKHDAIIVTLSTYEGHNLVDLRTHAMKEGRLVPTPKGLAMVVRRLPELLDAITKAHAKAQELGLIDADEKADA